MNGHYNKELKLNFQCEQKLSNFGKKVLSVLVKKWNREKKLNGTQSSWPSPAARTRIHKRKVLTFMSKETPIQDFNSDLDETAHFEDPGIEIVNATHSQPPRILDNNYNIIEVPLLHNIPKSKELLYIPTLDATSSNSNKVTSNNLLITVNENTCTKDISINTAVEKSLNGTSNEVNIDWQNMFDTELISENSINKIGTHNNINAEKTSTVLFTHSPDINNIIGDEIMHKKLNKSFDCNTKVKQDSKKRKAQSKITEAVPKKFKKPTSESKNVYRKQKYTTTVKNWLDNADPDLPIDEHTSQNTDKTNNSMKDKVTEKDKLILIKKTVQTRLANRDGIMKFSIPKNFDNHSTADNPSNRELNISESKNIADSTDNITNIKLNNFNINNKKILGSKSPVMKEKKAKQKFVTPIKSPIPVKDVNYNIINVKANDSKHLNYIVNNAIDSDVLAVLIYSNGFSQLNNHHTEDLCKPTGILFGIEEQFYLFKGFHQSFKNLLKQLLEQNNIICFDGKSILIYLKSLYNIDTHALNMIDVKIGACILEPDSSIENISDLQKLLSFTPEYTVATECYLQKTAWYTTILRECARNLTRLLTENDLWRVFVNIEMKLLPIIADMEYQGVEVDVTKLKSIEDTLLTKMKAVEQQCYKAAGKVFQINSSLQVRTIIYEELKLDAKCNVKIRETIGQGVKSTSEPMLRSLVSVHPLPKLILEYRHLHKAHATFLAGIAQHVKDGIVRPTWVQTAAVTGRIASNNPNLQAIPKTPFNLTLFPEGDASNETILFRSVYTSAAGWCVLAADFKHVECRVWANVAADNELLKALSSSDLFKELAKLWLKKPESKISTEDRERTKRMVYATLYGAGCRKLMDILDLSYEQTLTVMASFNRTFPSLKSFGSSVVSSCLAAEGELRTACGRRRNFRHITSRDQTLKAQAERQAVNFLVQGSAADLCKVAMVRSVEELRASGIDYKLVLQIHDELVFHVRNEQLDQAAVIIKRAMEGCGNKCGADISVPLPVQLSVGHNWAQITEYTRTIGT